MGDDEVRELLGKLQQARDAIRALVRAGEEDGRYLAIVQQEEWAEAVRLARKALED